MKKRERGAVIVTGLLVLGGFVAGSLLGLKLGSGNGAAKGQSQAVEKSKTPAAVKKKTYTLKDKAIYDENGNKISLDDFAKQKEDYLNGNIRVIEEPTADGSHVKLLKKWKTEKK